MSQYRPRTTNPDRGGDSARGQAIDSPSPRAVVNRGGRQTDVLQVSKYYYPAVGGIEQVVQTLAEGLNDSDRRMRALAAAAEGLGTSEVIHGVRTRKVATVGTAVLVVRTADTDAGWAALLLTGVLLAAVIGYATLRDRYRTVATAVLAGGVATVLGTVVLALAVIVRTSTGTTPTVPLFDTRTLAIRVQQYEATLEIARTYPLFGPGSGNFYLMTDQFGLPDLRGIHGIAFSYLATAGFVGAGAYLLGILAVLTITTRRFVRGTETDEGLLWGALVCGMIGFHAYSLWDLAHLWDAALSILWLSMGVAVGANPPIGDGASRSSVAHPS